MSRGKFITLEGIDGAGKTTQRDWLEKRLKDRGVPLIVTREPGGTPFGEKLREMLLGAAIKPHAESETLLMFAARREHIDKVIAPALEQGTWVLCDRFTDATYAYQCGGSGVAWDKVAALERWVQGDLQPDLTLFFDVAPEVGLARAQRVKAAPDRFEREAMEFYERVRAAYRRRAAEDAARIKVIDADRPVINVQESLEICIARL